MSAFDKMSEVTFWVALPFRMLTENSKSKCVRVVGLILSFLFFPTVFIAAPLMILTVVVGMFEDA